MQFTFLGTSAGKPTRERNVSALGVEFDQESAWYLFDCGEATQHQLQKSPLRIGRLSTIFITHLHGDHIFGLPGLLASKKMDEALKDITIYGPPGIKQFIECAISISQMHLGFDVKVIEYEAYDTFVFNRFRVTILPLVHSIESFAFYIEENDICNRLDEAGLRAIGLAPSPLYGELKKGKTIIHEGKTIKPHDYMLAPVPGRRVIIAGDNQKPEILGDYLDKLDLLIHEATYTKEVYDKLPKKVLHTTAKELSLTCARHNVKNLIATHISARFSDQGKYGLKPLYEELMKDYDGGLYIANDFDRFYLYRGGKLEKVTES
jgi:ribonuclease Z